MTPPKGDEGIQRYLLKGGSIKPSEQGVYARIADVQPAIDRAVEQERERLIARIEAVAKDIEDPGKWMNGRVPGMLTDAATAIRSMGNE